MKKREREGERKRETERQKDRETDVILVLRKSVLNRKIVVERRADKGKSKRIAQEDLEKGNSYG